MKTHLLIVSFSLALLVSFGCKRKDNEVNSGKGGGSSLASFSLPMGKLREKFSDISDKNLQENLNKGRISLIQKGAASCEKEPANKDVDLDWSSEGKVRVSFEAKIGCVVQATAVLGRDDISDASNIYYEGKSKEKTVVKGGISLKVELALTPSGRATGVFGDETVVTGDDPVEVEVDLEIKRSSVLTDQQKLTSELSKALSLDIILVHPVPSLNESTGIVDKVRLYDQYLELKNEGIRDSGLTCAVGSILYEQKMKK